MLQAKSLGFESVFVNTGNAHGVGKLPYMPVNTQLPQAPSCDKRSKKQSTQHEAGSCSAATCNRAARRSRRRARGSTRESTARRSSRAGARSSSPRRGSSSPTVHLLTSNQTRLVRLAQFIQAEEAAVGINVVIEPTDTATANARAAAGTYDAYLGGFSGSPDTDRNIFQFVATPGSFNWSGYSNPRVDLILANARKADKKKAIATLYHAALKIVLADRPVIYLYHPIVYAAVAANVSGVQLPFDALLRVAFARYR